MISRTVTTIAELKRAKQEGADEIIAKGKLAKNLIQARVVTTLSTAAIAALTAAVAGIAAAPVTGGISGLVGSAVAAPMLIGGIGLSTTAIVAVAALVTGGLTVTAIVALYKEYKIKIDNKNQTITFYK